MSHALIIDQNVMFGTELKKRLLKFGFDSVEHVWRADDARTVAKMRPPDLILIGDGRGSGDVMGAARVICEIHNAPVLMLKSDAHRRKQQ